MPAETTLAFDTPGIGRPPRLMAWVLLAPLLLWLVLFVVVPTIIMIVVSVSRRDQSLGEVIYGWPTLENYGKVFGRGTVWPLLIAGAAGAAATAVSAAVAIAWEKLRDQLLSAAAAAWPVAVCLILIAPAVVFDLVAFPRFVDSVDFSIIASGSPAEARADFLHGVRLSLLLVPLCGMLASAVMWSLIAPAAHTVLPGSRRLPIAFGIAVGVGVFWAILNLILLLHVRESDFASLPLMLIVKESQKLKVLVVSVNYAAFSTAICAIMGYPVAYFIGKAPERWRNVLLMFVMIPFWTSFLVRTYAWVTILRQEGVLNSLLLNLGWISDPLDLYPSQTGVMIGLVYTYLPFMILPIYTSIERLDNALIEAAFDLGASPLRAFHGVVFPLTKPGIVAGILLVFVPAIGMFAVNDILGGQRETLIGNEIEQQFGVARDKPFGAALGMILLLVFIATYYLATRRRPT